MSEAVSDPEPQEAPQASPDGDATPAGPKKRRRGSRGGRNRKKPSATANGQPDEFDRRPDDLPDRPNEGRASPEAARAAEVPYIPAKPKIVDTRPARPVAAESNGADDDATSSKAKKRRRRGGRGRGRVKAGGGASTPAVTVDDGADVGDEEFYDEPIELDDETLERRRGRERKGRPVGRYLMAVHVQERATQIAVMEGRSLIEHYVSRPQDDVNQIDGNIYLARVQNVLPGMEAAFVDIGTPKNAVLYRGDVRYDSDDILDSQEGGRGKKNDLRIEQMLKAGQTILCQVTKNPIGTKGARLTQEVSLPGRFVVLIPNSDTYGISKRLSDDERKRLRRILDEVKPAQHGVIVRTAAEGVTTEELRRDVLRLLRQWEQIEALSKRSKAPALLYREPDMAVRVIREEFNKDYRGVVIDDPALYGEVREYVESISPELADRVELYSDENDPLPIFERYHVHEQLHKAIDRKVWLPSGGSLIIERTEALTVIDVNTGKNVGTSSLEETVFRNNLEAAQEIARQLRLRDIGGIIVIDFIDMEIRANREEVIKAFRDALARDKTRTQVFDISELGLVAPLRVEAVRLRAVTGRPREVPCERLPVEEPQPVVEPAGHRFDGHIADRVEALGRTVDPLRRLGEVPDGEIGERPLVHRAHVLGEQADEGVHVVRGDHVAAGVAGVRLHSSSSSLSRMIPRPVHIGQFSLSDSTRPSLMRLRVISTRPSSEMSKTCVRVLSRASASRKALMTSSRFALISMSMKSMTMMPPMSRSRSWRAISCAASRLLRKTVSSRLDVPTFLPVLTSMTVSASVRSMMSDPPDGSHTLRSRARWSCSCTW